MIHTLAQKEDNKEKLSSKNEMNEEKGRERGVEEAKGYVQAHMAIDHDDKQKRKERKECRVIIIENPSWSLARRCR